MVDVNPKSVLLTLPNLGYVHKEVMASAIEILFDKRFVVTLKMPSHKPIENCRNKMVNMFLEGDYQWWVCMDADNPSKRNPLELVRLNKDLIGLPTPVYAFDERSEGKRPIFLNAYDYVEDGDCYVDHVPCDGLQKVDAVGTGCFLMNRRVFDDPEMRKNPFGSKLNEDGTFKRGEDFSFCERMRASGNTEIYAHFGYMCEHFVELPLTQVVYAFHLLREREKELAAEKAGVRV